MSYGELIEVFYIILLDKSSEEKFNGLVKAWLGKMCTVR